MKDDRSELIVTCSACAYFDRSTNSTDGYCRINPPVSNPSGHAVWPKVQGMVHGCSKGHSVREEIKSAKLGDIVPNFVSGLQHSEKLAKYGSAEYQYRAPDQAQPENPITDYVAVANKALEKVTQDIKEKQSRSNWVDCENCKYAQPIYKSIITKDLILKCTNKHVSHQYFNAKDLIGCEKGKKIKKTYPLS